MWSATAAKTLLYTPKILKICLFLQPDAMSSGDEHGGHQPPVSLLRMWTTSANTQSPQRAQAIDGYTGTS